MANTAAQHSGNIGLSRKSHERYIGESPKTRNPEDIRHAMVRFFNPFFVSLMSTSIKSEVNYTETDAENSAILSEKQPNLIVMNHTNGEDIPVLKKIIKEHTKEPVYVMLATDTVHGLHRKFAMQGSHGIIPIDRSDKESAQKAEVAAVQHLQNGHLVAMYPEATWTPDYNYDENGENVSLLPFKRGAARIAQKAGAIIKPLVTEYSLQDGKPKCDYTWGGEFQTQEYSSDIVAVDALRQIMMNKKDILRDKIYGGLSERERILAFSERQAYDKKMYPFLNPMEEMRVSLLYKFNPELAQKLWLGEKL
ncbi:MAG: 1-acyl-sn-glycerol-3-phosphate acyltransferase [Candidatus Nomurabacteria bacterium]|jgi:1-acyl-sn-glycerol-3-phosphate acyltransferase|nr:1-acyl-sn-glycerol-3-phosphate acyltransferase [Candidatus Nomurabacteria bacterium]